MSKIVEFLTPFWTVISSNFLRIVGGIALIVLGFFTGRSCSQEAPVKTSYCTYSDTTTTVVYDTISHLVGKEDLKVRSIKKDAAPSLPPVIDSLAVAVAYFQTNEVSISHKDENISAELKFDITENQMQNPQLEYDLVRPEVTHVVPVQNFSPPKFQLYAGAVINHNPYYTSVSPELHTIWSNRHLIGAGTDLMIPQPNFTVRYATKLFKIQGK